MENIIINEEIKRKASKIIEDKIAKEVERQNLERYIKQCIQAEICPICGNELNLRNATKQEIKKEKPYTIISDVLYCSNDNFICYDKEYISDYEEGW